MQSSIFLEIFINLCYIEFLFNLFRVIYRKYQRTNLNYFSLKEFHIIQLIL